MLFTLMKFIVITQCHLYYVNNSQKVSSQCEMESGLKKAVIRKSPFIQIDIQELFLQD